MKIYLKLIMKYEIFDGKLFLSGKYFLFLNLLIEAFAREISSNYYFIS